jgi:hypothetical protein
LTITKRKVFNVAGFGVILIWLVSMTVLVKKSYFRPAPVALTLDGEDFSLGEGERWMAVFQGDEKIGYVRTLVEGRSDGYSVFESAVLNLRAGGVVHRVSTKLFGHLNRDTSLRSFVFVIDSGLVRFEAKGRVQGSQLLVKTGFGGDTRESKVLLQERTLLSPGLWPRLLEKGLIVGARYRFSLFDPSIMAENSVEMEVLAREEVDLDGVRWDTYKVRSTFSGLEMLTWVDENGIPLIEEGLMGFRLVRTTADKARLGITAEPNMDVTEAASIPSDKVLEDPSGLHYLRIQLEGISLEGLDLNSGRQRLKGTILEIEHEPAGPTDMDTGIDLAPFSEAGLFIQSDHPDIKAQADRLVARADGNESKVRRILNWVHETIDKRGTVSVPNALETLRMKAGDCNEHAVLFAALCRAAGIPTKVSAGLVYTRNRFYYHAWNEVFLGHWLAVDALMGQMPADVTHIRFVEGDLSRQADMVRVMGKLKLRVLKSG